MTLIDLGDFKLRFDSKEVRISIDGETIDIGARREEQLDPHKIGELLPWGQGGLKKKSNSE